MRDRNSNTSEKNLATVHRPVGILCRTKLPPKFLNRWIRETQSTFINDFLKCSFLFDVSNESKSDKKPFKQTVKCALFQPGHSSYLLVVIKYGVHVLDPDSVDRSIKDEPLAVWRGRCGKRSVANGEDAVGPFVRHRVKWTVQLAHGDGLWIEYCDLDLILLHDTLIFK